jgi:hypothetical protein
MKFKKRRKKRSNRKRRKNRKLIGSPFRVQGSEVSFLSTHPTTSILNNGKIITKARKIKAVKIVKVVKVEETVQAVQSIQIIFKSNS